VNASQLTLLRPVSRSFYISIRALPRTLREPVALAYLLARATDTIADTDAIDVDLRIRMLQALADAIQGSANGIAGELKQTFAPLQKNEAERNLIESVELCLRRLAGLIAEDRADVRVLLKTITRGQLLDLTRWRSGLAALANAEELREYAYLVAGCVGEFWTRVCFRKLLPFANRPEPEMLEFGRQYGCGLQLVNIVRDAGNDLRDGRCYFPEDQLRRAGLTVEDLQHEPAAFHPIYQSWIDEARVGLNAGIDYSVAIRSARVRVATSLPALIGARTLALLQARGLDSLRKRVKVPRSQVRAMIGSVAITLANPDHLRAMFNRLR
jgi:farnesyl-diphosphate farnesyltransferase